MPSKPRVAERLIQLREDLGLSQEEAAARTEGAIKLRQWQRWESGESEPYKRNLAKLSETFGIPIAEFFEDRPRLEQTQLDRIEAKLDRLLAVREPETLGTAFRDDDARKDREADDAQLPPSKLKAAPAK